MSHTYGTAARLPVADTTVNTSPTTFTINCATGTTVLWLGMVVTGTTARTGGDPTYNGIAMTAGIAKTNAGPTAETHIETWYMINPPTGSAYTISIPNTATSKAITYTAATGLAGSGFTSSPAGGTTKTNVTIAQTNPNANSAAGAVGDIIFAIVGNGATTWPSNTTPVVDSGTTIHSWDAGTRGHGTQYTIAGTTAAVAMTWTFGTAEDWVVGVDRFTEVALSTGNTNFTAFFD